jgi:hypothetical protein
MAEALIECGIGATRALVMDGNTVTEVHFERDDGGPLPGSVHVARLTTILDPGRRGIMRLGASEGLIEPLPYCPEGGLLRVEVVRSALYEAGRPRLAKLRNVAGDTTREGEVRAGPGLMARLKAAGHSVTLLSSMGDDRLEAAGWSEMIEAAQTGHVHFGGGLLTISPTPAMTVIDIDGPGDLVALAKAAAVAVAEAIRCFDITGSIGVDFPSLEAKADRTRLGDHLDAHLAVPFERTAVNGFGFVQIVRPRARASFVEAVRTPGFAALELLRRASRGAPGGRLLTANPAMIVWLEARPDLLSAVGRATGGDIRLLADNALLTSGAYASII